MAEARGSSRAADMVDRVYVKDGKNQHQFDVPTDATVGAFKNMVAERVQIDAAYLKIICKGKVLDHDAISLARFGVRNGSRLTMLLSEEYHVDRPQVELLGGLKSELVRLEAEANPSSVPGAFSPRLSAHAVEVLDAQLTVLLEKIDGVDTLGKPTLRAARKALVLRAQAASEQARANQEGGQTARNSSRI